MTVQPYLFFAGTCEEAFHFYAKALGGSIVEMHRFKDMPPSPPGDDAGCGGPSPEQLAAMGEKIMHVSLSVDGQIIMGSDNPKDAGEGFKGFSISLGFPSVKRGHQVFDALSKGATVTMPFGETFWAKGFGMLTDRFGIPWMVNAGDKPSPPSK